MPADASELNAAKNSSLLASAPTPAQLTRVLDNANARLAASGSALRIEEAWLFTVGPGTDPYRRLRTGPRWAQRELPYYLDETDFTPQLSAAEVNASLESSYDTWNQVQASSMRVTRFAPASPLGNIDILDGRINNAEGECVSIIDVTAENLDLNAGTFVPAADIVAGGWMPSEWFANCLGSENIIGVAISFSAGDVDSDNCVDLFYVEQFYNEGFEWVTSGATLFGDPVDLESIAVHENGHALGLGHFGGAPSINKGTFQSGNWKHLFDPLGVMNPGYAGGEIRDLYPTDETAMRTLY